MSLQFLDASDTLSEQSCEDFFEFTRSTFIGADELRAGQNLTLQNSIMDVGDGQPNTSNRDAESAQCAPKRAGDRVSVD